MTSKEILNELKELIKHEHLKNVIDVEKYYGIIEQDLKTAELINDKLYFLSRLYKNASKEDLLKLFILYADAFEVIEKYFDVKCFNYSNYRSNTLEIYQDNERKAMVELFDSDEATFSLLCDLRWRLKNDK